MIDFSRWVFLYGGWGIDRVKKHQDWNGKYCPHRILSEGRWNSFKDSIEKELKALNGEKSSASKPVKTAPSTKPKTNTSKKAYNLPSGILKITKGAGVKALQEALADLFCYPDKWAKNNDIDGYYGPKTADAVKRFQLMYGLVADGVYGPKTKVKLEALLK